MVKHTGIPRKVGFFLIVLAIVFFSIFPFIQMLSISLKYPGEWDDPGLIPQQFNFEAYKELLNIGQSAKDVPESVLTLLDETPDLTSEQREAILQKYRSTGDVFPFLQYFANLLVGGRAIYESVRFPFPFLFFL